MLWGNNKKSSRSFNIFPMISGSEFEELKDDIAVNGLLEPIILTKEAKIIDGRNRYRACVELGISPEFRQWDYVGSIENFANAITVKVKTKKTKKSITGALFASVGERIVEVDGYNLEAIPEGNLLLINNKDVPGIVGKIGDVLGKNKINIAGMQVGRDKAKGHAVMLINIDSDIPDKVLTTISKISGITQRAKLIKF